MRLHVVGLAHSTLTADFEHCAFSARTRDFASMMRRAGWDVVTYAMGESDADARNVSLGTVEEQRAWWPEYVPTRDVFNDFDPNSLGWLQFNARALVAITQQAQPRDVLCLTMGQSQMPIARGLPDLFHVETGIGYSGVWAPYRVFESKAWRDFLAGVRSLQGEPDDARFFDEVIPRSYDPAHFAAEEAGSDPHLLYIGRLMGRKGPHVAAHVARAAGLPLHVAGQGIADVSPGRIICDDGTVLEGDVTYLGVLKAKERAQAMADALAVLTPTSYFEPFGGVSAEAQLCGTPAIVSNWGGLPENVEEGTGFACATLREWVDAVHLAPTLDREYVRKRAVERWGFDAVARRFATYFRKLGTLPEGWYSL